MRTGWKHAKLADRLEKLVSPKPAFQRCADVSNWRCTPVNMGARWHWQS